MMVKIESKEKLAKLLAMEDLDVQHKQVPTAYFDVKNRTLILPMWKDMSNSMYDLLVGHEVGHALFTPTSEKILRTLIEKTSKHCVNIVEDARIEALVKRKYPGLRKQMFTGYNELIEKDFFGISHIDPNTMKFLDKINLHFKIPSYVDIDFNNEQMVFINRIENAKTFKDVSEICIDLAEYIKENPEIDPESETDNHFDNSDSDEGEGEEEENDTTENSGGEENDEKTESGNDDNSGENGTDDNKEKTEDENEEVGDETDNEDSPETGKSQPSSPTAEDNLDKDLKSDTYENFENNVSEMVDVKTTNIYLTVPEKINYDSIVNYKDVHKNINDFYVRENFNVRNDTYDTYDEKRFKLFKDNLYDKAKFTLAKIKKEGSKNINHMAMDFERKKSADIYKRTSISKTGVLDTNKLFSAKYNEDVFKKNVKTPDGKSHGLVLFIDWSGSMSYNLDGCIKQLIEMVLFCKKVNIPFEVYSFTDVHLEQKNKFNSFKYKHDDLVIDNDVRLRNYFSSKMSTAEFNNALLNICLIANAYSKGNGGYSLPLEERLGYTPLCGAIMFSEHIIKDFKNQNNVQEVHAVWITDGEGNQSMNKWDVIKNDKVSIYGKGESKYDSKYKVYIQDKKTKKSHLVNPHGLTQVLFEVIKNRLGISIVGFYIDCHFNTKYNLDNHYRQVTNTNENKRTYEEYQDAKKEFIKKAKKDGYLIKTQRGYDEYYVISNVVKEMKKLEVTENMTARRMANIFSTKSNQFKNSRVLLSRFIDLITVNS